MNNKTSNFNTKQPYQGMGMGYIQRRLMLEKLKMSKHPILIIDPQFDTYCEVSFLVNAKFESKTVDLSSKRYDFVINGRSFFQIHSKQFHKILNRFRGGEMEMTQQWTFEDLDLIGALKDVQTDCDICLSVIYNGVEETLVYWKSRYNRMVSVANALRKIISYDDSRFSKPYSTRKFDV